MQDRLLFNLIGQYGQLCRYLQGKGLYQQHGLAWGRMFQGAFERFGLDRRGHGGWFDVFLLVRFA